MNYRNFSFRGLLAFITLQFFFGAAAYAQTTIQTWVSGFGSDTGTCSFAVPCKTLAFALTKTTAGGEISIDSPGELGIATINKSITINAIGSLGSIIVPSGSNGVTIAAGASDSVILKGLSINGTGVGNNAIYFMSGGRLHIENCTISNFANDGIYFSPNATSKLYANNVSVRGTGGNAAVHIVPIAPSGNAIASLNNLKLENNARGVRATEGSTITVRNSIVTGSTSSHGFAAAIANPAGSGTVDFTVENSLSSGNVGAGFIANGANATMRVSNVTATLNGTYGLYSTNGGKVISFGNNRISGNLPSDGAPTQTISSGQI